ncbi:MAG TPA: hypothetical protein VF911_21915 [Thermoanaerobaculia bacterium]
MIRRLAAVLGFLTFTTSAFATADLSVSLSSPSTAYTSGSTATYTATFANNGPDAVTNPTVNTQFTAYSGNINATNIQVTSKPAELTCGAAFDTPQGPTVSCTAPSLPAGYSGQIVVTATISGTGGRMEACSTIQPAATDPITNNNGACVNIEIDVPSSDLTSTITSPTPSRPSGSTATYTTTFGNSGPDAAANFSVSNRFSWTQGDIQVTNIQVVSKPAAVTCGAAFDTPQGPTITCTAASLPSGFSGQLVVSATLGGSTGGNLEVCSTTQPASTDPNTGNNASCLNTIITIPQAELYASISSPTPSPVASGTTATYVSTFGNSGPDAATNAALTVRFGSINGTIGASNIQVMSKPPEFTCSGPVATPQGPTITCTAPSIPSGYAGQVTTTAQITGDSGQMNVCTAISSQTIDPGVQANGSCVTVSVVAAEQPTVSFTCPLPFGQGTNANSAVTISEPQSSDTTIALSSSNPGVAAVPTTLVIPAGSTSAPFTIQGVGAGTAIITITPPAGFGAAQNCSITVNAPAAAATIAIVCLDDTVVVGAPRLVTVEISEAQGTPVVIALASSNIGVATVPTNVTIGAGATSATFTLTAVSGGSAIVTATPPDGFGAPAVCTFTTAPAAPAAENIPALGPFGLAITAVLLALAGLVFTRNAA